MMICCPVGKILAMEVSSPKAIWPINPSSLYALSLIVQIEIIFRTMEVDKSSTQSVYFQGFFRKIERRETGTGVHLLVQNQAV
jgi:hypothetical protein